MLPFLKSKDKAAGVANMLVKHREPDEKPEENQEDESAGIHACAAQLISCIHAHDIKGAAEALRDAFQILDSEPHEEGEHISPHSYDAQNKLAGE